MSIDLTDAQIQHIMQGIKVPAQPQILVDLQMEQLQPQPNITHIAELISQDVSLSGTVLKIVNSAGLAGIRPITSIHRAVMLLGYNAVINIVNGISIKGQLSDEQISQLNGFWDTAMDIALVSAAIARQIGCAKPDEHYALGLFHNVGIPLMLERYPNYLSIAQQSYCGEHLRIIDAENHAFNTNHAVIGYYVARSWHLPTMIAECIAEHHNMQSLLSGHSAIDSTKRTLLCILKLAEHICHNYRIIGQQTIDYEWQAIQELAFDYLCLSSYDLSNLRDSLVEQGVSSVIG